MLKRRVWKPIAASLFTIVLLSVLILFYMLLRVDFLIPEYLILVVAVFILFLYLIGVLLFYGIRRKRSTARRIRRIFGVILSVIMIAGCISGSIMLLRIDQAKSSVTKVGSGIRALIGVYVKKDDPAQSLNDLADYPVAVLIPGNERINSNYALGKIAESTGNLLAASEYPGITDAAKALRDGDVRAMAVNESYLSLLKDSESLKGFSDELRLIDEIAVPITATQDNTPELIGGEDSSASSGPPEPTPTPVVTPEPTPVPVYGEDDTLIFYISGIDRWGDEIANSHSDVNILVAVNAKTKQILVVNTPRDYFIENPALGGGDKLTHCAFQGVSNSMAALEKLYGIHINNYARVNYNGFVRFIMAIGDSITIDNPVAFRTADNYFEAGQITLTGYQALDYARERHAFANGDLGRGQNHVRIILAVIDKLKSSGVSLLLNYSEIIDTMAGAFETDLTSSQISDLVKIASRDLSSWDVKTYAVSGSSGKRVTASGGSEPLYIIYPKFDTVEFASSLFSMISEDQLITDEILSGKPSNY